MDTPLDGHSAVGTRQRSAILGSVTIPGKPAAVASARAFIRRVLAAAEDLPAVDSDAATLLTSELVTNAIRHSDSGAPGGTVTVVVLGVPDGVLVEVIDDGSEGTPVLRGSSLATDGHGLFLVQQLAAQWGYARDPAGTTVWFHLAVTGRPPRYAGPADDPADAAAAASTAAQMAATSSAPVT